MRVALVNPGSPIHQTGGLLARFVTPIPPLGLAYLAAVLEQAGHTACILDQYCDRQDNPTLVAQIAEFQPDLVGFSCLTSNMTVVLETVGLIRAQLPGVPVVFGNTHAAVFKERIIARNEADFCVRAEGEEPLLGLVAALARGELPVDVANVSFKDASGQVVHNPDGKPSIAMEDLPLPAWHLLDLERYKYFPVISMHDVTLPIQGSRGCAYGCTFCAQDQVYQAIRQREPGSICDEIEAMIARHGVTHFGFNDAYFPLSVKKGHQFLDELERRGLGSKITWITETRVDKVDLGLLERMAQNGCRLIMYGVEFGSEETLKATKKHAEISQARLAIQWTHEAGILTLGLYVLGMPGEDAGSVRRTLRFARELNTDIAKFNIAVPLPGSVFFDDVFGERKDELDYAAFHSWYNPYETGGDLVWSPEGMAGRELVRLQREGMLRYYLRPSFVLQTLRRGGIKPRDFVSGGRALVVDLAKIHWQERRAEG